MKKTISLTNLLSKIKDKRRKQGTRHTVTTILVIVILSTLSGYNGYHALDDFMIRYKKELKELLKSPKHGLPSYSAIRRVVMNLDFNIVSQQFYKWVRRKIKIKRGEWLQVDGKGIKGTVTDYDSKFQNFTSLVSLFMNRTGIVLQVQQMKSKKQSEIGMMQLLIEELGLTNVIITADALHCQKKRLT